jgi:hypothetical protein
MNPFPCVNAGRKVQRGAAVHLGLDGPHVSHGQEAGHRRKGVTVPIKNCLASLATILVLSSMLHASAGVVAEFGSGASNLFSINNGLTIGLTVDQKIDGIEVAGTDQDGNQFAGRWATTWTLASNNGLTINITNLDPVLPLPPSPFQVLLRNADDSGYKLFTGSFGEPGVVNGEYSLSLDQVSGTDFTEVAAFVFNPTNRVFPYNDFDVSMHSLSIAVPEPSTSALLAIAGIPLAWIARRRIANSLRSMVRR